MLEKAKRGRGVPRQVRWHPAILLDTQPPVGFGLGIVPDPEAHAVDPVGEGDLMADAVEQVLLDRHRGRRVSRDRPFPGIA